MVFLILRCLHNTCQNPKSTQAMINNNTNRQYCGSKYKIALQISVTIVEAFE